MSLRYGGGDELRGPFRYTPGDGDCNGPARVRCPPSMTAQCSGGQWYCQDKRAPAPGTPRNKQCSGRDEWFDPKKGRCVKESCPPGTTFRKKLNGGGICAESLESKVSKKKAECEKDGGTWRAYGRTGICLPKKESTSHHSGSRAPATTPATTPTPTVPDNTPSDAYRGFGPTPTPLSAVELPPVFDPQTALYEAFKAPTTADALLDPRFGMLRRDLSRAITTGADFSGTTGAAPHVAAAEARQGAVGNIFTDLFNRALTTHQAGAERNRESFGRELTAHGAAVDRSNNIYSRYMGEDDRAYGRWAGRDDALWGRGQDLWGRGFAESGLDWEKERWRGDDAFRRWALPFQAEQENQRWILANLGRGGSPASPR